jgi:hypothetical protein
MTWRGRKYVVGCASIAILLAGLLVLGIYGYGIYTRNKNEKAVLQIARQLGMQDSDRLLARRKCWALGFECGHSIIFTTSLTQGVLRTRVQALGFQQRYEQRSNGAHIFSSINIGTEHSFTADGNDDSVNFVQDEKIPHAWEWDLIKPPDQPLNVTFYETSTKSVVYAFDGRPIRTNVVEVLLWDSRP